MSDTRQVARRYFDAWTSSEGDTVAAREVLDRTIGKPGQTELLQRVEELEQRVCVYLADNGRGVHISEDRDDAD